MYVRDCHIENVGPIRSFDLQFPVRDDGAPQPVMLLGENGTGKSTLLSMVADAILLFQQQVFTDITPKQALGSTPYLRLAGSLNQRNSAAYGLSALRFEEKGTSGFWVEKTGKLKVEDATSRLGGRFSSGFAWDEHKDPFKDVSKSFSSDDLKEDFTGGSYCFFPSERRERPSWLNDETVSNTSLFRSDMPFQGRLGKPLYVTNSVESCIPWLLDVMLDARIDLNLAGNDEQGNELYQSDGNLQGVRSRQLLDVLNAFLRSLLGSSSARFGVSHRANRLFRLCIVQGEDLVPNLSCLSSGQATLLGMFMTILRYSDCQNRAGVGSDLNNVRGMVLIDEADAHLHTRLQYEVLPLLIKRFPGVQFLITSHSPLLLRGMEDQLGRDGFLAIEMPSGTPRSSDDYPEVAAQVRCLSETKEFQEILNAKLSETVLLPRVFMEGSTDVRYIETAFHVLGHGETLTRLKLDTLARLGAAGDVNGGSSALKKLATLFKSDGVFPWRVLLLYDFDAKESDEEYNALTIRSIPRTDNSKIGKGIENLLPPDCMPHDSYYSPESRRGDYGESICTEVFEKERLCKDLCDAADPDVFGVFEPVVEIIENWLNSISALQTPPEPVGMGPTS